MRTRLDARPITQHDQLITVPGPARPTSVLAAYWPRALANVVRRDRGGSFLRPRAEPNGRGEQDCGVPSCRRTETRRCCRGKALLNFDMVPRWQPRLMSDVGR